LLQIDPFRIFAPKKPVGIDMAKRGRPVPHKKSVKAAPKKATAKMAAAPSELDKVLTALEGFSVSSLRKVMESCEQILERTTEGERRTFIEEVTARAAGLGMSITDLLKRAVPGGAAPSRPVAKKAAGKTASPGVKYRGPDGQIWSGRGRPARWITELEAQGRKREEFVV
jgi:DNA-binding protein H-NS